MYVWTWPLCACDCKVTRIGLGLVDETCLLIFKPLGCLLLNCLSGSALLRRPSTLKLASLPLASVALSASRYTLGPHSPSTPRRNTHTVRFKVSIVDWQRKNEASIHRTAKHFSVEGGRNRERKCRIPHITGTLRYMLFGSSLTELN